MYLFILFFSILALSWQNVHAAAANVPVTQPKSASVDKDKDMSCNNASDEDDDSYGADNEDANGDSDTSDNDSDDTDNDDITFKNPTKGYDLTYPNTWTKNENMKGFDLFLVSPKSPDGRSLANVSVITEKVPSNVDLKQYADKNIKTLLDAVPSIKVIEQGQTTLSDLPAYWILYTRGDDNTKIMHFFAIDNGQAYLLTLGASQDAFDKFQDTFDDIVDDFNIEASQVQHTK